MDKIQFGRTGSRIYSFSESKKKKKRKSQILHTSIKKNNALTIEKPTMTIVLCSETTASACLYALIVCCQCLQINHIPRADNPKLQATTMARTTAKNVAAMHHLLRNTMRSHCSQNTTRHEPYQSPVRPKKAWNHTKRTQLFFFSSSFVFYFLMRKRAITFNWLYIHLL